MSDDHRHDDPDWIEEFNKEANQEAIGWIRAAAANLTGGNCAFADDDFHVICHFAKKAIDAEMFDGVNEKMVAAIRRHKAEAAS